MCGHEGQQVPNKDGAISEQFDHRIREGGIVKTGYEFIPKPPKCRIEAKQSNIQVYDRRLLKSWQIEGSIMVLQ